MLVSVATVTALQPLSYSPELVTDCVRGICQNLKNVNDNIVSGIFPKRNQFMKSKRGIRHNRLYAFKRNDLRSA